MNLPNKLSVLRLILIPVFIALFYIDFTGHYLVACCVFAISAITDFFDGYIARKYNLITDLGKFLDSSADKVLVLSALVIICDANLLPTAIGGVGVVIILAREILISCLRMVSASKGLVLAADKFGKLKTLFQDITIVVVLICGHFTQGTVGVVLMWTGYSLFAISVILTIASGINYLFKNKKTLNAIERWK